MYSFVLGIRQPVTKLIFEVRLCLIGGLVEKSSVLVEVVTGQEASTACRKKWNIGYKKTQHAVCSNGVGRYTILRGTYVVLGVFVGSLTLRSPHASTPASLNKSKFVF